MAHQCRCFSTLHNAFAIPGPSFLCHRSRWSMHCPRRTNHIESTPSLNYAVPLRIAALLFTAMPMQSRSTLFQRQSWHLHAAAIHCVPMLRLCQAMRFRCSTQRLRRRTMLRSSSATPITSDRIYAIADHSLSMPLLYLTKLCHRFSMQLLLPAVF